MQSEGTFVIVRYRCLTCGHTEPLETPEESLQPGHVVLKALRKAWWE